jgi:hypothetical protein
MQRTCQLFVGFLFLLAISSCDSFYTKRDPTEGGFFSYRSKSFELEMDGGSLYARDPDQERSGFWNRKRRPGARSTDSKVYTSGSFSGIRLGLAGDNVQKPTTAPAVAVESDQKSNNDHLGGHDRSDRRKLDLATPSSNKSIMKADRGRSTIPDPKELNAEKRTGF